MSLAPQGKDQQGPKAPNKTFRGLLLDIICFGGINK